MIALVELGDGDYEQLKHGDVVYIPVVVKAISSDCAMVSIAAARGDNQIPHEIRLRVPRATLSIQAAQAKV